MQRRDITPLKDSLTEISDCHDLYENSESLYIKSYKPKTITLEQAKRFAECIKSDTKIKNITFEEIDINDECLAIILNALKHNKTITGLSIRPGSDKLPRDGLSIQAIAELLETSLSLKRVILTACPIGATGSMLIANALEKNSTLKRLSIDVCHIGSEAATRIIDAANKRSTLTHLSFYNADLDDNLDGFVKSLEVNRSLVYLDLSCNYKITDQGIFKIAKPLQKNTTLVDLRLMRVSSGYGQKAVAAMKRIFNQNYWMDELTIGGSGFTRTSEQRILQIKRESQLRRHSDKPITFSNLKELNITDAEKIIEYYLGEFYDKNDESKLSYADLFYFIEAISPSEQNKLKKLFDQPYFFEVFNALKKLALINKDNFKSFYLLSSHERKVLYDLFLDENVYSTAIVSLQEMNSIELLLDHSKSDLLTLFKQLRYHISLRVCDLITLLSLSSANIERLNQVVRGLVKAKMLNYGSYKTAFSRIMAKLPKVVEATVEKKRRKDSEHAIAFSQLQINHSLTVFTEHNDKKEYLKGGFGRIKKAYTHNPETQDTPQYSVKKLFKPNHGNKYAIRNTKFNRLLGREANFYERKGFYNIVTIWHSGKSLHKYTRDELISMPSLSRFHCVLSGLLDLEKLHSKFYIHGDITPANVIIDFQKNLMTLIDFDSTRKKGSHSLICTQGISEYLDSSTYEHKPEKHSFQDDEYAMGKVLSELFPDLYDEDGELIRSKKKLLPLEHAIHSLISAMLDSNRDKRSTNENSINFCREILVNIDKLNNEIVQKIAEDLLLKNDMHFENLIRGRTKARH